MSELVFPSVDGVTPAWKPLPRQALALSCPVFELLYGGQKGGGKTDFLVACFIPALHAAQARFLATGALQLRCRIVIFRRNLRDLKDAINKAHEIYKRFDPGADFNRNEKTWYFSSGATLEFAHLDGPDDHLGWNGQEIIAMGFDEIQEVPHEAYTFLTAQIRTADEYYKPFLMVRCTANPGGRHGDWVKKRFIDPHPPGNKILVERVELKDGRTQEVTRAFIPAALRDNQYLYGDGQYEARLRATLPEHLIKRYLEGDWNVIDGAFFGSRVTHKHGMTWEEFLRRSPGGVPSSWEIGFGLDWGASNPAATIICARDGDDRIWCIDELYCPGRTGKWYAEQMGIVWKNQKWSAEKRWEKDEVYGVVDSEAWAKFGADGASPGDSISAAGFRVFEANKDRRSGISQILERLILRPDGLPSLIVLTDRCPNLWRTLQTVAVDPRDPEDYDKRDEGHAVDALRFKLMDWPVTLWAETPEQKADALWDRLMNARARAHRPEAGVTGYE